MRWSTAQTAWISLRRCGARVAIVCVLVGIVPSAGAAEKPVDTLTTTDGRTLRGSITLMSDLIRVKSIDGKFEGIKFAEVAELKLVPAAPASGAARSAVVRHGLKAEYFSDGSFKDLRGLRLDNQLDFKSPTDLPSFATENNYSVRWTGKFVSDVAGVFSLSVVVEGVREIEMKVRTTAVKGKPHWSLGVSSGPIELKANEPVDLTIEAIGVNNNSSISLLMGRGSGGANQLVPADHLLPPDDFTDAVWRDWLATDPGSGLMAEYFEGQQWKTPAFAVMEPTALAGDRAVASALQAPYAIRWSGQFECPVDGTIELALSKEAKQPVRVWVDSVAVLDTFAEGAARKESAKLVAKAGQKWAIRIETLRTKKGSPDRAGLITLAISGQKVNVLPRTLLFPPADAPRPVLFLAALPSVAGNDSPDGLAFEVVLAGPKPAGAVRVDLVGENGQVFGSDSSPPYKLTFAASDDDKDAAPPVVKKGAKPSAQEKLAPPKINTPFKDLRNIPRVLARSTDSKGRVGVSTTLTLPDHPPDRASIGAGWMITSVGTIQRNVKLDDAATPARFDFPGSAGKLLNTRDVFPFMFQPLATDGQLQVRLSQVASTEEKSPVSGGVMIRDGLDTRSRYLGVFASDGQLMVIRRETLGALPSMAPVSGVRLPCSVRLQRSNGRVSLATSTDGVIWTDSGVDPMPVLGTVYAGVCNIGRPKETVTFESLTIETAGPEDSAYPAGVQLVNGTILGGQIIAVTENAITLSRDGTTLQPIARNDVAKILLQAVPQTTLDDARNRRGVLMAQGDVFESDIKSITPDRVDVDSIIFGPRTFSRAEAAAVLLNDVAAPAPSVRFELRLADGSRLLVDELKVAQSGVIAVESKVGSIKVAGTDVRLIRRLNSR